MNSISTGSRHEEKRQVGDDDDDRGGRPWSDLHESLLHLILSRISSSSSFSDYLRFSTVCSSWLRSAKTARHIPSPTIPSLLLLLDDSYSLRRPQKQQQVPFPITFPGDLLFFASSSSSSSSSCWLLFSSSDADDDDGLFLSSLNDTNAPRINLPPLPHGHVVVSMALSAPPTDPNFAVFVQINRQQILCCRPRSEHAASWTEVLIEHGYVGVVILRHSYYMVASRSGTIYVLCRNEELTPPESFRLGVVTHLLSGSSSSRPRVSWMDLGVYPPIAHNDDDGFESYAVESSGDLLVVLFFTQDSPRFEVFKVDPRSGDWSCVESLEDRVLYLSRNGSMSVSAQGGRGGNLIYLAIDSELNWRYGVEEPQTHYNGLIKMELLPNCDRAHWVNAAPSLIIDRISSP